jgi:hypothetical protein
VQSTASDRGSLSVLQRAFSNFSSSQPPYVYPSALIDHARIHDSPPTRAFEIHDFPCFSFLSPAVDLLYQVATPSNVGRLLDEEQNDRVLHAVLSKQESMKKKNFCGAESGTRKNAASKGKPLHKLKEKSA